MPLVFYFLASQPWICYSDDNAVVSLKKGTRKNTSYKEPSTGLSWDLWFHFHTTILHAKLGLRHVCY